MRQNDSGSYGNIAGIELWSYYKKNPVNQPNITPQDRFITFLNLDTTRDQSIFRFIENYQIFPTGNFRTGIKRGILREFRKLHKQISCFVQKEQNGSLNRGDFNLINSVIGRKENHIHKVSEKLLVRANENINNAEDGSGNYDGLSRSNEKYRVIQTVKYPNSFTIIYADLADYILGKSKIKNCENCHSFFVSTREWDRFCGIDCQQRQAKKRKYYQKKSTRISPSIS